MNHQNDSYTKKQLRKVDASQPINMKLTGIKEITLDYQSIPEIIRFLYAIRPVRCRTLLRDYYPFPQDSEDADFFIAKGTEVDEFGYALNTYWQARGGCDRFLREPLRVPDMLITTTYKT